MTARPIIYLHGFASSPSSTKARFFGEKLTALAAELAVPLDLSVPDLNAGDFTHVTLTRMLAQVTPLLPPDGGGSAYLIGSSLGGLTSALLAARHPERVAGLTLMAPAFGLARRWQANMSEEVAARWQKDGVIEVYHHGERGYRPIHHGILSDAAGYEELPDVTAPTLILHGRGDKTVPVEASRRFAEGRAGVTLVELESDHELIDVLDTMWSHAEPRLRAFLLGPSSLP